MSEIKSSRNILQTILTISIALVWLINGLFCKVLNLVPRHQLIVARILGDEYSSIITKAIGISEILMFVWILSRIRSRLCAIMQIIIVAAMNLIEFKLAPDLLLFGRINIILATVLIIFIYVNEFVLNKPNVLKQV
jgi:DoxX-like family